MQTPEHRAAYKIYHKALKSGELVRQNCMVCGAPGIGHHDDLLGKPLEILWLCRKHHVERHVFLGWGQGFDASILSPNGRKPGYGQHGRVNIVSN